MAALVLREGARFTPEAFAAFLAAQPDLGTKMSPRYVRVLPEMPVTATNKIHRVALRRAAFLCEDPVWWRRTPADAYAPLSETDRAGLLAAYAARGRGELLQG